MPSNQNGELPPRARRIHQDAKQEIPPFGTTSACAENTQCRGNCTAGVGNYLRVRGEYYNKMLKEDEQVELPPRARRIRNFSSRLNST